jgi:hypothetical protein
MFQCHDCGATTDCFLIRDDDVVPCCRHCLDKERRRRKRLFGEPTDGTLFKDE